MSTDTVFVIQNPDVANEIVEKKGRKKNREKWNTIRVIVRYKYTHTASEQQRIENNEEKKRIGIHAGGNVENLYKTTNYNVQHSHGHM